MSGKLVVINRTDEAVRLDARPVVPVVMAQAGPRAEEKFFEFFAASTGLIVQK